MIETEKDKNYKLLFYFNYSLYLCGMDKDFTLYEEAFELKQLGLVLVFMPQRMDMSEKVHMMKMEMHQPTHKHLDSLEKSIN